MSTNDVVSEVDKLIEQKEDELRALKATRRMLSAEKPVIYSAGSHVRNGGSLSKRTVDLDQLGIPDSADSPTLADRVKGALTQLPRDRDFTVPHIEALLKQSGFTVPGKSPRARIAMIMAKLEEDGLVIRTAKPKGFKPHKFRLAKPVDDTDWLNK